MNRPGVIFSPESSRQLLAGLDKLAHLLAVTLGPTQGGVLSSTDLKPKPELLTGAATIARRLTDLPDGGQDVGAMLLRNLVWRVHQRVGDGGATTATLVQAILHQAQRALQAGANATSIIKGIQLAAHCAIDQLNQLSRPARGEEDLNAIALSVTGHPQLSSILGEMFDILGPQAYLIIEDYMAPYLERVYLDGGRWEGSIVSPYMVNAALSGRGILKDCQVVLYNGPVQDARQLVPLIEAVAGKEPKHLLFVAHQVSGDALNFMAGTNQQSDLKIIAVGLKNSGVKASQDLDDLAILTGAELITPEIGRRLEGIRNQDLGFARRVEASKEELLVAGGHGSPARIRDTIQILQKRLNVLPFSDEGRPTLQMRLARLSGNAGILKIGALTQAERDYLHQKAEQGVKSLQAALEEGILVGGGVAYLRCIPAVNQLMVDRDPEEAMGIKALSVGLEAPARQIFTNAGAPAPGLIISDLMRSDENTVYDVEKGEYVDANRAGILDATRVLRVALETAVSGAMMAISTDTIILKKKPKVSYEP